MIKCPAWLGWIVLIIGILYLISDIMRWGNPDNNDMIIFIKNVTNEVKKYL